MEWIGIYPVLVLSGKKIYRLKKLWLEPAELCGPSDPGGVEFILGKSPYEPGLVITESNSDLLNLTPHITEYIQRKR